MQHHEHAEIPLDHELLSPEVSLRRARDFLALMARRRSVRFFSERPVPLELVEALVLTAGTSPSGAHTEPWTFVVVRDGALRRRIREIVEQEEARGVLQLGGERELASATAWGKDYLEAAPLLIVMLNQTYGLNADGSRRTHHFNETSSCIAAGILITAIHNAGLCTLTSAPLGAGAALRDLLGRPDNEEVLLLLPVGYPAADATVPALRRKALSQIMLVK